MPPRPPYRVTAAGKAKVYVSSAAVVLFVVALYFFSFSDVGSQKTLTQVSTSERRSQSRANMFRQRTVEGDEEPENSASGKGDDEEGEEEVEVKSKHSSNKSRDEDEAVEDTETKSSKRKGRNKLEEEEVEETRPKSRAKPREEEEEEVEEEKPSKKKKAREEVEEEEEKPSKKKRAKEVEEEEEEISVEKSKKKARKEEHHEEQQEEAPKPKKKSTKKSTLGEYPEFTNTCTKKPLPYTRDELRKIALEEFLPLLQEHREIFGLNKQGQAISHQLATYLWAKKLKEMGIDTFIESGILKGSCTRLIHLAHPKARIISMDPYDKRRFKIPHLRPEDDFVGQGKFQDFGLVDWTKHPDVNPKKTAIFLDDHQSHAKRLAHCIKMGFTHVFFDDNYMNFDSFSSKAMCTDDHGEPGDVPSGAKIMKFNRQINIEEKLRKPFLIYLDNFNFDMMGINATYFHYLQDWFHDNMVQYFEFPPFADDSRTPWQYTHTREVGQDPLFDCTDEDDPDKGDCELIKPFMLDQRYGADRESYLFYYGYAAWVTLKKNPNLPHLPDIQRDYGSRGNAYFDIQ